MKGNLIMYIYRTYFRLTNPVIDIEEARNYLTEDDMATFLKSDSRINQSVRNAITKIEWILKDEDSGYIELTTNKDLSTAELKSISDYVSGQNSDGIGEGFEQQRFACYEIDENGEPIDSRRAWDYEGELEEIMASFDWKTNEYIFDFVRKD